MGGGLGQKKHGFTYEIKGMGGVQSCFSVGETEKTWYFSTVPWQIYGYFSSLELFCFINLKYLQYVTIVGRT